MIQNSLFPNSETLYAACQSEDTAEQARAYEDLWGYLFRAVRHIVRDQPEPEAMAQDLAQDALERIHQRIDECREPAAFRSWSKRIVCNMALDELRRRKRLLPDEDVYAVADTAAPTTNSSPEKTIAAESALAHLLQLLEEAPISDRSRRVVSGRYVQDLPDEELAEVESELAEQEVRPSHIQVTRAKNIAKLRHWAPIQAFFGKVDER